MLLLQKKTYFKQLNTFDIQGQLEQYLLCAMLWQINAHYWPYRRYCQKDPVNGPYQLCQYVLLRKQLSPNATPFYLFSVVLISPASRGLIFKVSRWRTFLPANYATWEQISARLTAWVRLNLTISAFNGKFSAKIEWL